MAKKICMGCEKKLDERQFNFYNQAEGKRRPRCKKCMSQFRCGKCHKCKYREQMSDIRGKKGGRICLKCVSGKDRARCGLCHNHIDGESISAQFDELYEFHEDCYLSMSGQAEPRAWL